MIKINSVTSQRSGYVLEVSATYTYTRLLDFFSVFILLLSSRFADTRVMTSRASLTLHDKFTYFLAACEHTSVFKVLQFSQFSGAK